jgi:hypothetical protein
MAEQHEARQGHYPSMACSQTHAPSLVQEVHACMDGPCARTEAALALGQHHLLALLQQRLLPQRLLLEALRSANQRPSHPSSQAPLYSMPDNQGNSPPLAHTLYSWHHAPTGLYSWHHAPTGRLRMLLPACTSSQG